MSKEAYRGLRELREDREIGYQDILVDMLEGDQDLDLKTHIYNPKDFAGLEIISLVLLSAKYSESSDILDKFTDKYKRLMVSVDRLGRTEILKTISALMDKETVKMSISEKMSTNMKS